MKNYQELKYCYHEVLPRSFDYPFNFGEMNNAILSMNTNNRGSDLFASIKHANPLPGSRYVEPRYLGYYPFDIEQYKLMVQLGYERIEVVDYTMIKKPKFVYMHQDYLDQLEQIVENGKDGKMEEYSQHDGVEEVD
jgi:hypothetical protein